MAEKALTKANGWAKRMDKLCADVEVSKKNYAAATIKLESLKWDLETATAQLESNKQESNVAKFESETLQAAHGGCSAVIASKNEEIRKFREALTESDSLWAKNMQNELEAARNETKRIDIDEYKKLDDFKRDVRPKF